MAGVAACSTEGNWWTASCVFGQCHGGVCVCDEGYIHDDFSFPNRRCAFGSAVYEAIAELSIGTNLLATVVIVRQLAQTRKLTVSPPARQSLILSLMFSILLVLYCVLRLKPGFKLAHAFVILSVTSGLSSEMAFNMLKAISYTVTFPGADTRPYSRVTFLFTRVGLVFRGIVAISLVIWPVEDTMALVAVYFSVLFFFSTDMSLVALVAHRKIKQLLEHVADLPHNCQEHGMHSRMESLRKRIMRFRKTILFAAMGSTANSILSAIVFLVAGYVPFTAPAFGVLGGLCFPAFAIRVSAIHSHIHPFLLAPCFPRLILTLYELLLLWWLEAHIVLLDWGVAADKVWLV